MADEHDQRNELDDFLVALRKVQKPDSEPEVVARARDTAEHIKAMQKAGAASEAHLRILSQN
jgi:hypothetical protein